MVDTISSLAMRDLARINLARTQSQLNIAASEVTSGKHYDMGVSLGISSSSLIDMRHLTSDIDAIQRSNVLTSNRLKTTQSVLGSMVDLANGIFQSIVAYRQSGSDPSQLVTDARTQLDTMIGLLSTTMDGAYLFGGDNSAVSPIDDYLADPPGPSRTAVQGAFIAEFGFPPDDLQVGTISAAQMDSYMSGSFAALFDDPDWNATFSSASDSYLRSRISPGVVVETPVTANNTGIRQLVSVLTALVDSGAERLNAQAFDTFAAGLAEKATQAAADLANTQGAVGLVQEQIKNSDDRLSAQLTVLEISIGNLESVDSMEASTRLNSLSTQLQISYAVTARLQQLSIMNYL
ncbi:MAG: flagellar hook-associated family protein [Thermomicrobiales bacterium]